MREPGEVGVDAHDIAALMVPAMLDVAKGQPQSVIAEAAMRAAVAITAVCAKPGHVSTLLHVVATFVSDAARLEEQKEISAGRSGHA